MAAAATPTAHLLMLGTFGFRPKATMGARAVGMATALQTRGWDVLVGTTPWDRPADAGRSWVEQGVRVTNTHAVRPALWPLAVVEMLGWHRRERPALVHVFKPKGFGDLAGRLLRHRTPLVVDMDDWEGDGGWNESGLYGPLQRRVFDWQERTLPRLARAVTVASRELERRAAALGVDPSRVHYVPNGLTPARIAQLATRTAAAHPPLTDAPAGPRILLYTRFVEFDPVSVVRVLVRVRERFSSARLIVAGASADGRAERVLTQAAAAAGVAGAITPLGWVAPDDVGGLARACDLAIHPFDDTVLNRAKCSVKLLELMAAGAPVVTTRVGENAQCVVHGESGWVVSPGDPSAQAAGVIRLLEDPDLRCALGRAAARRVAQEYRWDLLVDTVADAYRQALDAGSAGGPRRQRG